MIGERLDAIRSAFVRFLPRQPSPAEYQRWLQDYAHVLTEQTSLPQLLATMADRIDAAFQPEGLAIVPADERSGYCVALSRGCLSTRSAWQEGKMFETDHPLVAQLSGLRRALDLSKQTEAPEHAVWTEIAQEGACLVIPMCLHGDLMGWVVLGCRRSGQNYTQQDVDVLQAMVDQSCLALENFRLAAVAAYEGDRVRQLYKKTEAALNRRIEELTAIEKISRQLTGTLELSQVLDLLLNCALQTTNADRGVIALHLPRKRNLRLMASRGYPPELARYQIEPWPSDRGITGRVARTLRPVLTPDVHRDPDYVEVVASTRSQLSVPILHQERLLGVITLESDRLAAFGDEHLRFAGLLADHAAIAIYNAQLFEQLMEGRERLQAILNSIHDVVIVRDVEGRVILVNPRFRAMFGPEAERWLLSTNLSDISHILSAPHFQEMEIDIATLAKLLHQAHRQPAKIRSFTFSFRAEEGMRHIEATGVPVRNTKGEVIGQLTVLRDVTQQKEMEQFRADLTSMVVHNLQGPLAAILSSLEMLAEDPQLDRETSAELLRIALTSGRKLYDRIESLLWIRRLEDKQIPLELYTMPLPPVVRSVVEEYKPLAAQLGVRLITSFAPDLPPVLIDEDVIGRVFSNLLDNALKFVPTGGQVRVEIALTSGEEGKELLCSVADTGVGIPPQVQETLFARFRRGTAKGRRRGMGLGLHYCKVAVEAHGGRIWVKSQPGEGSTFFFTLPVA